MQSNILVLGGSIRGKVKNKSKVVELAHSAKNVQEFIAKAKKYNNLLSNSEIIAAIAMHGALQQGAKVHYYPLVQLFPPQDQSVYELELDESIAEMKTIDTLMINQEKFDDLMQIIKKSKGVVLSTPVYFGDRSSVANKFLQIASVKDLLKNKVFGMLSVGAKRNGGQETANIFGLYEAISIGALAVGNGPPTAQYGGTAIGGYKGHVTEDEWGLKTSLGTGVRVAQIAKTLNSATINQKQEKVHIAILVAIETNDKFLTNFLGELSAKITEKMPWAKISILNLTDLTIYRCLGCNTCPVDKESDTVKPHCNIQTSKDGIEKVRALLNKADGAIVAGLNTMNTDDLIFRYQVITERMRFIRRNDFELTNTLFAGLCYHQFGATVNPIHSLKTMVSYIRQNTIIHKPIEIFEDNRKYIETAEKLLAEFCNTARLIKNGLKSVELNQPVYKPHGEGSGYLK